MNLQCVPILHSDKKDGCRDRENKHRAEFNEKLGEEIRYKMKPQSA